MSIARFARFGLPAVVGALALLLPACGWDGNFTIFGYSTAPNYDTNIHTVYVPIFKNITYYRGIEDQLTLAVIHEIEAKTPFKICSDRCAADTELTGTIVNFQKLILNENQLNEIREAQTILTVEVVWRDLRTGEPLSQPRPRNIESYPEVPNRELIPSGPGPLRIVPPGTPAPPLTTIIPDRPENGGLSLPEPIKPEAARPYVVQSQAGYVPEIGQSLATAMQANVNRAALQIVHMMEKPW
jgi:hypothetical protein